MQKQSFTGALKIGVFKHFAKFIEKQLQQVLFFNNVAGQAYNFIEKRFLRLTFK